MGKSWSNILTPEALENAQRGMMTYSGLTEKEYEVKKVFIDDEQMAYMSTILVGNPHNPPLVLVHGFGGSGVLYYKVMKDLAKNFYVIAIDLLGMGTSSRVKYTCKNGDEADEFFMEVIEKWRVNMGNLTNFFIGAHSYGAYLFGTYASLFPQHIRKLVLLSPLGVRDAPEDFSL